MSLMTVQIQIDCAVFAYVRNDEFASFPNDSEGLKNANRPMISGIRI